MNVCNDGALRSWILSFGPGVRVTAPASLAQQIAERPGAGPCPLPRTGALTSDVTPSSRCRSRDAGRPGRRVPRWLRARCAWPDASRRIRRGAREALTITDATRPRAAGPCGLAATRGRIAYTAVAERPFATVLAPAGSVRNRGGTPGTEGATAALLRTRRRIGDRFLRGGLAADGVARRRCSGRESGRHAGRWPGQDRTSSAV